MAGMQGGCKVLGKGRAGRGDTERGKGTGREREGECLEQQCPEAADMGPGPRLEERAIPTISLVMVGDCEDPTEEPWAAGMGLGWGFGQGQWSLGRMLPPTSVSNLADPRPDPCSSLICLSSKAVKLIPSPAKSHGFHPSLPSSSVGLAGPGRAAARHCQCPARSPFHHEGAGTRSCRLPDQAPAAPRSLLGAAKSHHGDRRL